MSDEAAAAQRPATFGEVLAHPEFRAVFLASALSWIGDYMAKAAIIVLVYRETGSVALSAASFAVTYLPWVLGGPLLATMAERYSYRRVMVLCDLLRMGLIAAVAIPGTPVAVMLALLFAANLAAPPAQAARSALMPLLLTRDRLVVGLAMHATTSQAAQIGGYLAGAGIAAVSPRSALLLDALTFGVSALLVWFGVRERPPAVAVDRRQHLLRETGEGFRMVFGNPLLRAIAVMVFAVTLFAIVPEGLAAAWAERTTSTEGGRGLAQGMIMAAAPIGFILGGLLINRLVPPVHRTRLVRPFAVLAPLALVPALLGPPAPVIALMAGLSGFAVAGLMPTVNGLFVMVLPHGFRARAFGVMQTGLQITQGGAVLLTGVIAERFDLATVVGVWSVAGVALMLAIAARWPRPERFARAVADATPVVSGPPPTADAGPPRPADAAATGPARPGGQANAGPADARSLVDLGGRVRRDAAERPISP